VAASSETCHKGELILEMIELEDDYIIKMPPKNSYKIWVKVKSVKKGELNIVEPLEIENDD